MAGLKYFFESHIQEAGGDIAKGVTTATKTLLEAIHSPEKANFDGKKVLKGLSIKEIWEATNGLCGNSLENYRLNTNSIDKFTTSTVQESIGSGAFNVLTSELLTSDVIPAYEQEMDDLTGIYREQDAVEEDNTIAGMEGFTPLKVVPSGTNYPQSDWREKYVKIKVYKIGEYISLTRELINDDQTNQVLDRARNLGSLLGLTQHKHLIETFCDCTRNTVNGDTQAFRYKGTAATVYSSDHDAIDGQTNDNALGTNALGTTGVQNAIELLRKMTDEKGNRITGARPKVLVVPTNLSVTGWDLHSSVTAPDTASRAPNAFGPGGMALHRIERVVTSPYINTTDMTGVSGYTANDWYIGDPEKALVWLWSWRPGVRIQGENSEMAFKADIVAAFRVDYRGGAGWTDYRFVVRGSVA